MGHGSDMGSGLSDFQPQQLADCGSAFSKIEERDMTGLHFHSFDICTITLGAKLSHAVDLGVIRRHVYQSSTKLNVRESKSSDTRFQNQVRTLWIRHYVMVTCT